MAAQPEEMVPQVAQDEDQDAPQDEDQDAPASYLTLYLDQIQAETDPAAGATGIRGFGVRPSSNLNWNSV